MLLLPDITTVVPWAEAANTCQPLGQIDSPDVTSCAAPTPAAVTGMTKIDDAPATSTQASTPLRCGMWSMPSRPWSAGNAIEACVPTAVTVPPTAKRW